MTPEESKVVHEAATDLLDLYTEYCDSLPPELYGALLGWHERLEGLIEDG
jgi:hypothetical protein